jgi:hypothetical protein
VAKIQLAPALFLFKKYLIKKWLILSLVHPIGHSPPAGTKLAYPISEMNATICKIGRDVE